MTQTIVVENLSVAFGKKKHRIEVVKNVSYSVEAGKILGIVGESGSGKSVSSLAVMNLLDKNAHVTADKIELAGMNLLDMTSKERHKLLGRNVSMIFQDALNSLDPTYTIGDQMIEALRLYYPSESDEQYRTRALELLEQVGIREAEARLTVYPHQLSGGMLQRIVIAIAISSRPELLICDEPTTALDVIIQNQIVQLLLDIQKKNNMTMIFISHNLALISEIADYIIVMRNGQVVESGTVDDIFLNAKQPYTISLIKSLPQFTKNLQPIEIDAVS